MMQGQVLLSCFMRWADASERTHQTSGWCSRLRARTQRHAARQVLCCWHLHVRRLCCQREMEGSAAADAVTAEASKELAGMKLAHEAQLKQERLERLSTATKEKERVETLSTAMQAVTAERDMQSQRLSEMAELVAENEAKVAGLQALADAEAKQRVIRASQSKEERESHRHDMDEMSTAMQAVMAERDAQSQQLGEMAELLAANEAKVVGLRTEEMVELKELSELSTELSTELQAVTAKHDAQSQQLYEMAEMLAANEAVSLETTVAEGEKQRVAHESKLSEERKRNSLVTNELGTALQVVTIERDAQSQQLGEMAKLLAANKAKVVRLRTEEMAELLAPHEAKVAGLEALVAEGEAKQLSILQQRVLRRWRGAVIGGCFSRWAGLAQQQRRLSSCCARLMARQDSTLRQRLMRSWQQCTRRQARLRSSLAAATFRMDTVAVKGCFRTWVENAEEMRRTEGMTELLAVHEAKVAGLKMELVITAADLSSKLLTQLQSFRRPWDLALQRRAARRLMTYCVATWFDKAATKR